MIYEMFSEKMLILAFNAHFSIIALVFRIFAYYYLLLCTTNERTKKKLFIFFLTELVNLVNRVMNRTIIFCIFCVTKQQQTTFWSLHYSNYMITIVLLKSEKIGCSQAKKKSLLVYTCYSTYFYPVATATHISLNKWCTYSLDFKPVNFVIPNDFL